MIQTIMNGLMRVSSVILPILNIYYPSNIEDTIVKNEHIDVLSTKDLSIVCHNINRLYSQSDEI